MQNLSLTSGAGSHSVVARRSLTDADLARHAPAVFADGASVATSPKYTFISTAHVLEALREVGFQPVTVRQVPARKRPQGWARHVVRFRTPLADVQLADALPELVLLNSHDGTSAYELRAGLFRPLCTNGLLVSLGDFAAIRVPHRGKIVERVISGALEICARLADLRPLVERMTVRKLSFAEQLAFAAEALAIRYPVAMEAGCGAEQLLRARRSADAGADLWSVYNVVQEHLIRGGDLRRAASGRLVRTREIRAIREDVRINTALWGIAERWARAA